mgnify:CR=1 FL=1
MPSRFKRNLLDQLVTALTALRDEAMNLERQHAGEIAAAASDYRPSARNLLHYVGLRRHDLRDLQGVLGSLGLSSLGRLESHALASLDAVLVALHRVADRPMERPPAFELPVDLHYGPHVLVENNNALLETPQRQR